MKSKDILSVLIMQRHSSLDIVTDGQPGEIIDAVRDAVRDATTEITLTNKNMSEADGDCHLLAAMLERHGCGAVERVNLNFNPGIRNKGLVGKSGLLGTLSRLPRLRELWLDGTGLDDADTQHPIVAVLAQAVQDSSRFPKLGQLHLYKNNFSSGSQKLLWAAWRKAGRADKWLTQYDALEF